MTHLTDDEIRALMEGGCIGEIGSRRWLQDFALDLATECLARGAALSEAHGYAHDIEAKLIVAEAERDAALARVKELDTQARYDRDLIVDIRVALLKSQDAMIPTETLKRRMIAVGDWDNGGVAAYDELTAITAQRENRNE